MDAHTHRLTHIYKKTQIYIAPTRLSWEFDFLSLSHISKFSSLVPEQSELAAKHQ